MLNLYSLRSSDCIEFNSESYDTPFEYFHISNICNYNLRHRWIRIILWSNAQQM